MEEKTWWTYKHATVSYAWSIAQTIAASAPMAELLSDGERRITPRQIASLACDIAAAVREEMLNREWIELCDRPQPKP